MYENIIEKICSDIRIEEENNLVKIVQGYGFNVNKEELEKALLYDRNQYQKGFSDGREDTLNKVIEKIEALHGLDSTNMTKRKLIGRMIFTIEQMKGKAILDEN